MATHLHPPAVGLHVEDDAGVGPGERVPVRDALTGEAQLHLGEAGAAEQTQRAGRRLQDVAHGGGGTGSLQAQAGSGSEPPVSEMRSNHLENGARG